MIGFGNLTKRPAVTITALTDNRLIKIDPQEASFFDTVLRFKSRQDGIKAFIAAISEVKDANIKPFYKAIYDIGNTITYKKHRKPATGHSYLWWVETASEMPTVDNKNWHLATEYQYYAFLVWLINQLVKSGKSVKESLNMVVYNSKELGHYYDSKDSTAGKDLELIGLRGTCGVYDLANANKILLCSNKETGGFWLAGGCYRDHGYDCPLAYLDHRTDVSENLNFSVGLLVL